MVHIRSAVVVGIPVDKAALVLVAEVAVDLVDLELVAIAKY